MEINAIVWNDHEITAKQLAIVQAEAVQRCQKVAERIKTKRELVFSHSTALELMGIEVPSFNSPIEGKILQDSPRNDSPRNRASRRRMRYNVNKIHLCEPTKSRRSKLLNVSFHEWKHESEKVTVLGNLSCVTPVAVWKQLAVHLSLEELVVLGDSMMRKNPRLKRANLNDFRAAMHKQGKKPFKGKHKCDRALLSMRENTDSSQETRVRLLLEAHGFTNPIVNFEIPDKERGKVYAVDIAFPELNLIVEYDGAHHSEQKQWNFDVEKRERLHEMGWTVITVKASDLSSEAARSALVASILTRLGDTRIRA